MAVLLTVWLPSPSMRVIPPPPQKAVANGPLAVPTIELLHQDGMLAAAMAKEQRDALHRVRCDAATSSAAPPADGRAAQ